MNTPTIRRVIRACARHLAAPASTALAAGLLLFAPAPAAAQPANDACANAIPVVVGQTEFTLTGSTPDGPIHCGSGVDVWFRFTPPRNGFYRVSTCGGTNIDTVIAVHADNCAAPTLIGCNDQFCSNQSRITFFAQAGTPVLIRVARWSQTPQIGGGTFTISEADDSPTAFTYQGRLERDGVPYTGTADFRFGLASTSTLPLLTIRDAIEAVPVVDGLFTVPVDIGDSFSASSSRFLTITVRTPADGNEYTQLSPNQPLTIAPFAGSAIRANTAQTANTATVALSANTANTADTALTATTATTALTANTAASVPWTGITGVPAGFADGGDSEGPWISTDNGIRYGAGRTSIGPVDLGARFNIYDEADPNLFLARSGSPFGTILTIGQGGIGPTYALIVTGPDGPFGPNNFVLRDVRGGLDRLVIDGAGRFGIGTGTAAGRVINVVGGAHCTGTTWVNASSRDFKTDFQPVNPADVLRKVAALPISTWSYRADLVPQSSPAPTTPTTPTAATPTTTPTTRHMGPTAEDFASAFGLGADSTGISTVDQSGVALAAIQALANENAELRARLDRLEKLLAQQAQQSTNAQPPAAKP